jgi:hypothetical protein
MKAKPMDAHAGEPSLQSRGTRSNPGTNRYGPRQVISTGVFSDPVCACGKNYETVGTDDSIPNRIAVHDVGRNTRKEFGDQLNQGSGQLAVFGLMTANGDGSDGELSSSFRAEQGRTGLLPIGQHQADALKSKPVEYRLLRLSISNR